ncbi:uncharacterized protein LOC133788764 isoform X2 [Humulus lupulus]|uniref:uncharacterized protein LOC133788764 isoform X2 n=1 Tax=Humulus lupulus TaxID=3486 RepID=UPI002B40248F|nr:uncharacterized protein LOC133788764 isoform X2 [Humulus lupulus]
MGSRVWLRGDSMCGIMLGLSPTFRHANFPSMVSKGFSFRFRHWPCCGQTRVVAFASSTDQLHPQVQDKLLTSPELVALEYADLNLPLPDKELGNVRIRQHVNPLKASFSVPVQVPHWNQVFRDPTLPLMVDIGSGSGRFLMWLGKRNAGVRNYLGLEIREKLVNRAQYWVKEINLDNVHFIFANATNSFKQVVSTYPGPLMMVSILCPDPHFKKRHQKRRVVQKPLVDSIATSLMGGGEVGVDTVGRV